MTKLYRHKLPAACSRGCGQPEHGDAGCGAFAWARAFGNRDPLSDIAWLLSTRERSAELCHELADILRGAGYEVGSIAPRLHPRDVQYLSLETIAESERAS